MPQYLKNNDKYIITYITGPRHVALGIALTLDNAAMVTVVKKKVTASGEHGNLDEKALEKSVIEGVIKANNEFSTGFSVSEIDCIENDSPAYELYSRCAYLIVKGVKEGIEFQEIDNW